MQAKYLMRLLVATLLLLFPIAASLAQPESAPQLPLVVIDPGHPSEVSAGDALQNGLKEVEINWRIAGLLVDELAKAGSCTTLLTRPAFAGMTTNRRRSEIANDAGAVLMVRLHCDSAKGRGFTLYYPDATGTHEGVTGPSDEVISASRDAAHVFQRAAEELLKPVLPINPIRTDRQTAVGGKRGALIGSIHSRVPVVTVEMVYLNNASDAAFIGSPEGQRHMTETLARGVADFLSSRKPVDAPMKKATDPGR